MLVSAIARFNAINQMHNAQWGIMSTHMAMGSMLRNIGAHGGSFTAQQMQAIHEKDTQMQLDLENYNLMYMFYSAWEKQLAQQQKEDIKRSFSTFA